MIAADADDLLAWKGWVESRFRQLTLKVSLLAFPYYLSEVGGSFNNLIYSIFPSCR